MPLIEELRKAAGLKPSELRPGFDVYHYSSATFTPGKPIEFKAGVAKKDGSNKPSKPTHRVYLLLPTGVKSNPEDLDNARKIVEKLRGTAKSNTEVLVSHPSTINAKYNEIYGARLATKQKRNQITVGGTIQHNAGKYGNTYVISPAILWHHGIDEERKEITKPLTTHNWLLLAVPIRGSERRELEKLAHPLGTALNFLK